jgi:hypothetical protein
MSFEKFFGASLVLLVAGCGSEARNLGEGVGGSAASGGTSSGGTSAGGTNSGGTSAGGTSSGGTSSGGTSSGGSGGVASGGASGAGGSAGKVCGGFINTQCGPGEYCDFPGHCGATEQTGVCKPMPDDCLQDCPGVCGCDGKIHCNACLAAQVGVDVSDKNDCWGTKKAGENCASETECMAGLKCCYPCGIPGCQNQCMAPDASGQCPAFP